MQSYDTNYRIPHNDLEYGRKLGEGGFGDVFEGTWQHSQVAIKKLKMQSLSQEASQELETEAKIMAELRHDNIVGFRGFCFESPNYALVMEYMSRGSLYMLLHESSQDIDWHTRVQISFGAGAGLVYLHSKDILHRDIKSLNVLLHEKEGTLHAKLSDFGLSVLKIETMASSKSRKGFAGTLQYGAPELHDDESHQKASDVYSYAVMLWEIAARQVPFANAKTSAALMRQVIMGHQEAIPEGTPQVLKETIELGRKVDPSERPTAEQMVSSLKFLMQSLPKVEPMQSKQPASRPDPSPYPKPMSGLQGNYASGGIEPFLPKKANPAVNSLQGNLASAVKIAPKQQPLAATSLSGSAGNLHVSPPHHTKNDSEEKLALQQAEIESLKHSMEALLKIKEQEEKKKEKQEELNKQKQREQQRLKTQGRKIYEEGLLLSNHGRHKESLTLFEQAANTGYPAAYLRLGWLFAEGGRVGPKNTVQSEFWFKKAAESIDWFQSQAKTDDADAKKNLGICYDKGIGIQQDFNQAAYWYGQAAALGDATAENNLGVLHEMGRGVPPSLIEAAKLYRGAADKGYAVALNNLAICYENGRGVPQSNTEARKYYMKAATLGYAIAQNNLGICFYTGSVGAKNFVEAVKCFQLAADQGEPNAQNNLGICYYNGEGVAKNYDMAAKLYLQAAEQGHPDAQYKLGICFEKGRGVPVSPENAKHWYRLADKQGHQAAKVNLDKLLNQNDGNKQRPSLRK